MAKFPSEAVVFPLRQILAHSNAVVGKTQVKFMPVITNFFPV